MWLANVWRAWRWENQYLLFELWNTHLLLVQSLWCPQRLSGCSSHKCLSATEGKYLFVSYYLQQLKGSSTGRYSHELPASFQSGLRVPFSFLFVSKGLTQICSNCLRVQRNKSMRNHTECWYDVSIFLSTMTTHFTPRFNMKLRISLWGFLISFFHYS